VVEEFAVDKAVAAADLRSSAAFVLTMAGDCCRLWCRNAIIEFAGLFEGCPMNLRQDVLSLIEPMSEEQLALLLPLILSVRGREAETVSSEASVAYEHWVGAENDIYDEVFADELAAR
jgi:hypothetical protein